MKMLLPFKALKKGSAYFEGILTIPTGLSPRNRGHKKSGEDHRFMSHFLFHFFARCLLVSVVARANHWAACCMSEANLFSIVT